MSGLPQRQPLSSQILNMCDVVRLLEHNYENATNREYKKILLRRLYAARWLERRTRHESQERFIARRIAINHECRDAMLDVIHNRYNPSQLQLECLYNRVSMYYPYYRYQAGQWCHDGFV